MFNHRFSSIKSITNKNRMNKKSQNSHKKIVEAGEAAIMAKTPAMKTTLTVAAMLTLILASTLTMTGCSLKQNSNIDTTDGITNILDYVTVDFNGKNGEGTAYVNVDYNGIETEMVGGEEKVKEMDEVEDLAELTKYINAVSSISFNIDKNEGLSNGDQVIVSVSYDNTAAESAGVNFGEQSSKTFEVKGLKK